MKFVTKFHKKIKISLIVSTCMYFFIFIMMFCNYLAYPILLNILIELTIVYLITLVYIFFSWVTLNLIEKNFVYEKENLEYYRDIIKSTTPSQLSYIDDYSIEYKKDIIATILMLHLKGNIRINNNKIKFISKFKTEEDNYYNLSKSEVAILEYISRGESPFRISKYFKRLLIEDLEDAQLIEKNNSAAPHFWVEIILQCIYGVLLIVLSMFCITEINVIIKSLGISIIVFYIMFLFIELPNRLGGHASSDAKDIFMIKYKKLTPRGNQIRMQLTGLKLFLKDYSNMHNRNLKEIELWDEYIIYSVILNHNKKIQNELIRIINSQFY